MEHVLLAKMYPFCNHASRLHVFGTVSKFFVQLLTENTEQKMKLSVKSFYSKCEQICRKV